MPAVSIGEIVDFVGGQFTGPGDRIDRSRRVAPLAAGREDQLSFLSNRKYAAQLAATKAGAILVPENLEGEDERWIRVDDPYFAFARIMTRWFSAGRCQKGCRRKPSSLHQRQARGRMWPSGHFATIGDNVVIGNNVTIFQSVSIEAGSVIGDDCIIYPNVVIYDGTRIGRRCIIHAGVVIGSDGYGFAMHEGKHHKIPQIGIVRIEDDVEIGAGTTIDRAALGETVIGEGTKIDNLVQIGHNVKIGKHCLLVSQVGIAGSTELGDHVFVAGQSGFSGHLKIGHRVQVAAKSAVLEDVPDDTKVMGSPAVPFNEFARRHAAVKKLARKKQAVIRASLSEAGGPPRCNAHPRRHRRRYRIAPLAPSAAKPPAARLSPQASATPLHRLQWIPLFRRHEPLRRRPRPQISEKMFRPSTPPPSQTAAPRFVRRRNGSSSNFSTSTRSAGQYGPTTSE